MKFSRILFAVALCLVVNQVHAAGSSGLRKKANYLGSKAAIYGITALASLQTAWALESDLGVKFRLYQLGEQNALFHIVV